MSEKDSIKLISLEIKKIAIELQSIYENTIEIEKKQILNNQN